MESKNDIVERKNEKHIFCKSIRNYFREYCTCTSIHGFRYFGEKRTYFERGWWFIVFSLVFAVCVYIIREAYHKWERTPVIVSFATSETPIYSIPFPAVTICPESKTRQSIYNHSDIVAKLYQSKKLNETERQHALYMSLLCDFKIRVKLKTTGSYAFSEDFFDFINHSRREKFLYDCTWMGESIKCADIFVPIITDEGICYTFNMLDRSDIFKDNVKQYDNFMITPNEKNITWNLDDGYSEDEGLETYPRRALFAGAKNALGVVLITYKDDMDYSCKNSLQGFRVILHTPMRIPRPSQQYFRVPLNEVVLGSIRPVMIETSETVKVYSPKRRECYFPSERDLKYFKIYTQLNCQLECLSNFTKDMCGCVNFYMPRENNTKICGAARINCMRVAEQKLQTKGISTKLNEERKKPINDTEEDEYIQVPKCDCMPICTDLTYDVETSQSNWDWIEMYKARAPNGKIPFKENHVHMSRLTLYFKTSQFVTSKRHELYGPTDFLANFGGLLGLFTGFSILSLMEIIYFLTVRLCCNIRLYGFWYGPEGN